MNTPIDPERLARLMEDAVGAVRPRTEALDLIRHGARRRRVVHRAVAVAAAFAVIAGGAIAYATVRGSVSQPTGPATVVTPTLGRSATPTRPPGPPGARDWDVDGDGRPDSAHIVPLGKGNLNAKFLLVVQMTSLGTQKIPFTAAPAIKMPPKGPRVVGWVDADSDGRAEIFVMVDSGASSQTWTIFKLVNGRITQVTMSGRPAQLPVSGTVMDNFGFSCDGPHADLVTYSYSANSNPKSWAVERDTYRWAGSRLLLVSKRQKTIRASSTSPRLAKYAGVRCGDLPQFAAP
jgi:hypothetical protein